MESVVMRVSPAVVETVKAWARPLETRPQVLDRMVKLAIEGPPEDWLVHTLAWTNFVGEGVDVPGIDHEQVRAMARRVLSRWGELRELALEERLGPDPEVIIAGESGPIGPPAPEGMEKVMCITCGGLGVIGAGFGGLGVERCPVCNGDRYELVPKEVTP